MQIADIPRARRGVEWPTAALAAFIYGSWFATTYFYRALPVWSLPLIGGWIVAWQLSLQHEILHGHPTRSRRINTAIAIWPLSLWLPYETYRLSHLRHHNDTRLTDPLEDPESNYWTPEQWASAGPIVRALVYAQETLLGRILVGPAYAMGRFWEGQIKAMLAGDRVTQRIVLRHGLEAAIVVAWIVGVCHMPLWLYFFAYAYVGTALVRVRSYAEHRADNEVEHRTAIVEDSWVLGPLFLFNNLHVAHHLRASLPWYELPGWYRRNRDTLIALNGGLVYKTYFDVARRFLFRPHDTLFHPGPNWRAP